MKYWLCVSQCLWVGYVTVEAHGRTSVALKSNQVGASKNDLLAEGTLVGSDFSYGSSWKNEPLGDIRGQAG